MRRCCVFWVGSTGFREWALRVTVHLGIVGFIRWCRWARRGVHSGGVGRSCACSACDWPCAAFHQCAPASSMTSTKGVPVLVAVANTPKNDSRRLAPVITIAQSFLFNRKTSGNAMATPQTPIRKIIPPNRSLRCSVTCQRKGAPQEMHGTTGNSPQKGVMRRCAARLNIEEQDGHASSNELCMERTPRR